MLSACLKKAFVAIILSSFVSTSFAFWFWNRNVTNCYGNYCNHVVVKKHCNNGKCWVWKEDNRWRR